MKVFFSIAAFTLAAVIPSVGNAEILSAVGSFAGENHSTVSATAVADFKTNVASIGAGTFVSQTDYQPIEITHIGPSYTTGGDAYTVGVISGLEKNDIVYLTESQQYRSSSADDWSEYYGFTSYVLIDDYTHTNSNTILNWLNYVADNGDGTFSFVKGSGQYWLVDSADQLDTTIGGQYRVQRNIEVWQGGSLVNPVKSSRGYYTGSGITGGSLVSSFQQNSLTLTTIPEPAAMTMLGLAVLGMAIHTLRSRKA